MKHIFLFLLIVGFGALTHAQTQYEVDNDGDGKILKGIISKDLIINDPSFSWFQENQSGYTPDQESVNALQARRGSVELLVFAGTWNRDTRYILPKFFRLTEAAAFPEDRIILIGVANKKANSSFAEQMHITSIPTFIVLKEGREVGRVTVTSKSCRWDKQIEDILNSIQ
jgi:hypothetical protein